MPPEAVGLAQAADADDLDARLGDPPGELLPLVAQRVGLRGGDEGGRQGVEPVGDFDADKRADGSRPQQLDKDTGLPLWQVVILDADEEAGKKETTKVGGRVWSRSESSGARSGSS